MESSQILKSREKYCSGISGSESGWTTYIASPDQDNNLKLDDDHDDGSGGDNNHSTNKQGDYRRGNYYGNDDGDESDHESDDSMASDASSGPSYHDLPCKSNEGNLGGLEYPFKHAITKYSSSKQKPHKQMVKQRDGARMKVEKEESLAVFMAKSAASSVQSRTKVRKPN